MCPQNFVANDEILAELLAVNVFLQNGPRGTQVCR